MSEVCNGGIQSLLNAREKSRRIEALQEVVMRNELGALILTGTSYLGHKGAIRYLFDFNIIHRYAYGLVLASGEPQLILPRVGNWLFDPHMHEDISQNTKVVDHPVAHIASMLKERGLDRGKVGVVGLGTIMAVEDYAYLKDELPGAEIFDASHLFARVRARKSQDELEGYRHTSRIADEAFEAVRGVVKPGIRETEVIAQMYKTVQSSAATDCIFLMLAGSDGKCDPYFRLPRERKILQGDTCIFSIEFCGPEGYWIELSRMYVMGRQTESAPARCAIENLRKIPSMLKPGIGVSEIQGGVKSITEGSGLRTGHISGHGIGLDVIERPFIGELVKPSSLFNIEAPLDDGRDIVTLESGMVLSFHPHIVTHDMSDAAYIADTYIVTDNGGSSLFKFPFEVIHV